MKGMIRSTSTQLVGIGEMLLSRGVRGGGVVAGVVAGGMSQARGVTKITRFLSSTTLSPAINSRQTQRSHYRSDRIASACGDRRTFFSLPDVAKLLPDQGGDGDKQQFHARKILPYTQQQLYSLISDIPSYPNFIPFCLSSTILSPNASPSSPTYASSNPSYQPNEEAYAQDLKALSGSGQGFDVRAELEVGFKGFRERFTSRVEGRDGEVVKATVEDSPLFNKLQTTWSFQPASSTSPHATNTPTSTLPSSASTSESDGPTLLTIDLSFSFVNPLHRIASQAFLPKVSDLMVEAFEKRCLEVYGPGKR